MRSVCGQAWSSPGASRCHHPRCLGSFPTLVSTRAGELRAWVISRGRRLRRLAARRTERGCRGYATSGARRRPGVARRNRPSRPKTSHAAARSDLCPRGTRDPRSRCQRRSCRLRPRGEKSPPPHIRKIAPLSRGTRSNRPGFDDDGHGTRAPRHYIRSRI
jgi:hypothetical protein